MLADCVSVAAKLKAEPLYQFAGQALLHIEFTLPIRGSGFLSSYGLAGFFAQQDWSPLREEYVALLQRQQHVSSALQLARLDSEQREAGFLTKALSPSSNPQTNRRCG